MISIVWLNQKFVYYPFGNTPAVSLTQDLPPEQDADILLLGCGDVRNILFTCFADGARKIDVTCCDIEPLIHARNILLYTLLIEDTANFNIEKIWNICYHWKLDKGSLKLLETQTQKLLGVSESIEQWHGSVFGPNIRFCDERSLSRIRSYWMGFLSNSGKANRLKELQAAIDRARVWRKTDYEMEKISLNGLRTASPIGHEVIKDMSEVANHWWDYGIMPSSTPSTQKPTDLNPALLYSPDPMLTVSSSDEPLLGIPLCTAFTPIAEGSAFHFDRKGASSTEYLVDCAKIHFKQWASAFRRAVANKSVIRIFCGDALAFSFTLRNCLLTGKRSMNLPNGNCRFDPLELYHGDYGHDTINAAPLSFDIVDTSNLVDSLGPLNVLPVASVLLKYHPSSMVYTEMLVYGDLNLIDRLNDFFGVDARSMSLLLGLVGPDLFTNATESFEEDPIIAGVVDENDKHTVGFARSRLRWRRLQGCHKSSNFPHIRVEAKELAKFLVQVHNTMFKHEDLTSVFKMLRNPLTSLLVFARLCRTQYNRASFASLLSFLKASVIVDWDQCVKDVYNRIFSVDPFESITPHYTEDLLLNMHLYGVDNGLFQRPTQSDVSNTRLALTLPISKNVPDLLCITIQVPRKQLKVFTRMKPYEMGNPTLACSFDDGDPDDMSMSCIKTFSSIRMTFGSWHEETKENELYPYIHEDAAQLLGNSDMFLSFMVPTRMLLQSKRSVPWVTCELIPTPQTQQGFSAQLGGFLRFARFKVTSKNVFVTQYMPGTSALPAFALASAEHNKLTSATVARFTHDGSKINTLTQRATLESEATKALLAIPSSTVEVKFKSPWTALICIAQSEELKLEFPVPVSLSKYKVRIARKSSYVEVESPLFDPFEKDAASFLFPVFITEASGATLPMLWTSTRIDLDVMPPLDLKNKRAVSWLVAHISLMFSNREKHIRESNMTNSPSKGTQTDIRTDLKDGLFAIFMHYIGLTCQQAEFFALSKTDDVILTLILPSCLRLDLVNHTIVLDAAIIPLTKAVLSDPQAAQFIQEVRDLDLCQVKVSEAENCAWKAIMPALVERCRTATAWKHAPGCEYIEANEVPLPKGLTKDDESPICSCGLGKFPPGNYLQRQMKRIPALQYMLSQYATRAAISPIFAVPYVEKCTIDDLYDKITLNDPHTFEDFSNEVKRYGISRGVYNRAKCILKEKCVKCGQEKQESVKAAEQRLLLCSKCRLVRYCSTECQKADWKKHKPFCSAIKF